MINLDKPAYYRKLFLSRFIVSIYDPWVWLTVFGRTANLRNKILGSVPKNAKVAIDLATGTGATAITLKKHFPSAKVFASDLSERMLAAAIKKAKAQNLDIRFSVYDAVRTTYPSGKADFVSITFAIHDVPHQKRIEIMKEAFRLLKKNGVFAIYDFHSSNNLMWFPLSLQFLLFENKAAHSILKENLQAELKSVGFLKTSKKTYYGGSAQIVSAIK